MPKTQLQLGAWGGRRYGSFAGRAAAVVITGGRFVASHVYRPGIQKAALAKTGVAESVIHHPGFQQRG